MPKISIVMPIYNTGEQLFKTLSSIMGQKEKDYEVLMMDDCSDNELTQEIENTFERFDPRFKVIRQDKQMGAAMCRNNGFKNGEWEIYSFFGLR